MTLRKCYGLENAVDLYVVCESEEIDPAKDTIHHRLNTLKTVANAFPADTAAPNFNFVDGYYYPREDKDYEGWIKRAIIDMAWHHTRGYNLKVRWIIVLKDYEQISKDPELLDLFKPTFNKHILLKDNCYLLFGRVGDSYLLIDKGEP